MGKMNYGKYDMSEQLTVHAQCTMYTLTYAQALQKKWNGEVCDGDEWLKDSTFDEEMMEIRTLSFTHQKRWEIILLP